MDISLYVGIGALIIGILASFIALRSLSLSTSITRPFLNVYTMQIEEAHQGYSAALRVIIENTGNLPADQIAIDITLRDYNDKFHDSNRLNQDITIPALCFPGQKIGPSRHELNPNQYKEIPGNFVVIKIAYRNKYSGKQYETIRGFWGRPIKDIATSQQEYLNVFIPEAKLDNWT